MSEIKTRPTRESVEQFVASVEHPTRRQDAETLVALMSRISGEPPVMWGPSIIGFGSHSYTTRSGHSGEMPKIGFSPRKAHQVLYLTCDARRLADGLARLGKHKTGVGCLYVNKLADIDLAVLESLIADAWRTDIDSLHA